jgi:hypothetical protein
VAAGFAGSAHAAVAGLQQVTQTSVSNSTNKSATVSCPAGKQVTGAGGSINAAGGQVALRVARPSDALKSVTASGAEDQNGFAGNWQVAAYAVCATPPAGLERVSVTSPTNSSNKSATATCPGGKRLLGTGAELTGGGGEVALNDVIPGSALGNVSVQALEDGNGTTAVWSVTAIAICANPVAGRERIVAPGPSNSLSPKIAAASCPAGKQLTGVGGEVGGGGGDVIPAFLAPNASLDQAVIQAAEDEDGTLASWSLRPIAICAAASQRVVTTTPSNSNDKGDLATCPSGKLVTGAGAEITGGLGEVMIDDLTPFSTEVLALGVEDGDGSAANWSLSIHAICATPLPGLEVVSSSSVPSSTGKTATATCPVGKRLVGPGAEIDAGAGAGEVLLDDIRPTPGLTSVTVRAFEDETGLATDWTLTAHAVCADPPAGLELVTVAADPDSDPLSVTATCPAGKNLLGLGGEIDTGSSLSVGQVVMDDVRPSALLTSVTVTGIEDQTGFESDWAPRAHAICASP